MCIYIHCYNNPSIAFPKALAALQSKEFLRSVLLDPDGCRKTENNRSESAHLLANVSIYRQSPRTERKKRREKKKLLSCFVWLCVPMLSCLDKPRAAGRNVFLL